MLVPLFSLLLSFQHQDTVLVTESICERCAIRMERVATLGDDDGPGMLTSQATVAMDPEQRFLVAHMGAGARVSVFSPTGTFVRSFGRGGGGPGEYGRVWRIAPFANGVLVYDDVGMRSTLLTKDFAFVETRQAPETPQSLVVREDGSGVMAALVASGDLASYPLHEFDSSGRRRASLGAPGFPYRADRRELFERFVSPAHDPSSYWANHSAEYAFEQCYFGRQTCRRFFRAASWFPRPNPSELNRQVLEKPPAPALWGVSQDGLRYLWTISRVADRRWRSARRVAATEPSARARVASLR